MGNNIGWRGRNCGEIITYRENRGALFPSSFSCMNYIYSWSENKTIEGDWCKIYDILRNVMFFKSRPSGECSNKHPNYHLGYKNHFDIINYVLRKLIFSAKLHTL